MTDKQIAEIKRKVELRAKALPWLLALSLLVAFGVFLHSHF